METFCAIFHQKYQAISRSTERGTLAYRSALQQEDIGDLLKQSLEKDLLLSRTTEGTHRDDLECLIEEVPIRRFASQGQRKSFLIALKLAQYEILRANKGFSPILLLDDLYDKLDPDRVAQLFQLLHAPDMGQVFLTDTQGDRIAPILAEQGKACSFFQIFKEGNTAYAKQISHYEKG
jgi:DNA replication and repair protein RecF